MGFSDPSGSRPYIEYPAALGKSGVTTSPVWQRSIIEFGTVDTAFGIRYRLETFNGDLTLTGDTDAETTFVQTLQGLVDAPQFSDTAVIKRTQHLIILPLYRLLGEIIVKGIVMMPDGHFELGDPLH
jgi:hypothetical protein